MVGFRKSQTSKMVIFNGDMFLAKNKNNYSNKHYFYNKISVRNKTIESWSENIFFLSVKFLIIIKYNNKIFQKYLWQPSGNLKILQRLFKP